VDKNHTMNEIGYNIAFAESMGSGGHIGFVKYFLKRGQAFGM
jgi:hypothetical protein